MVFLVFPKRLGWRLPRLTIRLVGAGLAHTKPRLASC
jgi:hypothetical protein